MDASVSVALKSGLPLSFSGSFGLKVNTTGSAVKGTVGTVVIDLPAGNYFRAEATGAQLAALGQSLSGDFILESSTFIENALKYGASLQGEEDSNQVESKDISTHSFLCRGNVVFIKYI